MGVRELVGDAKGVAASEKVKNHCSIRLGLNSSVSFSCFGLVEF